MFGPERDGMTKDERELHEVIHDLYFINTLKTGDADLRFHITTVQDG